MEGLIKGLVDVAIGHHDRDNVHDDNNNDNNENSESIEERSRSSWAQVVSGDQDDRQQSSYASHQNYQTHNNSSWNAPQRDDYRRDDRQSRPQQAGLDNYQSEEGRERPNYNRNEQGEQEENADGWQTAHKKHHKKTQRIHMDHWGAYKSPPSEQEYSQEVQDNAEMDPSEAELSDYRRACAKLWELDFNRLTPGKDYELDVGEGKRVRDREDMAEASLFTWVSEDVLRKPTFSRFCALLDNYNPNEGCKEKVTEEERREQAAFIEEISRTAPIKYLYKYLSSNRIFNGDRQEFKEMLTDLWFTLYGRGGTSGCSSSFEHVFVGEIKDRGEQQVSGFHNWLQFYLEEAKGNADYQGYILPRRNGQFPDAETQLLTVQFEWNGVLKSLSSMFVGVSPEFELALYTLCFFAGGEDNHIEVGPYPVNIKCYRMGNKIGSAFPIAEE